MSRRKTVFGVLAAFLAALSLTLLTASGCDCYDTGERCWSDDDCCSGSCSTPDPANWPSISYCD
jgi:hypothetical protein